MISRLVDKIIDNQVQRGILEQSQVKIYRYGYYVVFEMCLNIFTGIVLGILLHKLSAVLIFWSLFIPLRSYCGGWHAKSSILCFCVSNLTLVMVVFITEWNWIPQLWLEIILFLIILILSPVDTEQKPLSIKEKAKLKKIVTFILIIHFFFFFINFLEKYILIIHLVLSVSLLTQTIKNKSRR